jgi:hypothetical protein
MDALPIVVNREQLNLLQDSINTAISELKDKEQAGQFTSADQSQQQQNRSTYGTDQYEKAFQPLEKIQTQLKSESERWNGDTTKPVSLPLNSYQIELLRRSLKQQSENANQETKQSLEDLLEQLPESSPQEDAD